MALNGKKMLAAMLVSVSLISMQSVYAEDTSATSAQSNAAGGAAGEEAAAQTGNGEARGDIGQGLIYLGTLAVLLVALDGFSGSGTTATTP